MNFIALFLSAGIDDGFGKRKRDSSENGNIWGHFKKCYTIRVKAATQFISLQLQLHHKVKCGLCFQCVCVPWVTQSMEEALSFFIVLMKAAKEAVQCSFAP